MLSVSNSKLLLVFSFFLVVAMLPLTSRSQTVIDIQVAPNVLNLQNQGEVVTVHTDIAYWSVEATSVSLNGIEIDHWKADNQGNFVAKFLIEEIKNLPLNIGEYNTLTLEGMTKDGEAFTGSYDVKVINVVPNGSGKNK
jgi:hypothetical protein